MRTVFLVTFALVVIGLFLRFDASEATVRTIIVAALFAVVYTFLRLVVAIVRSLWKGKRAES
jgi:uncharacterized membrane protein